MAISDILGLFASPQQYEQQRQAAMEAQALQTARLSPMEQGQYGIALGAQQLGRAIGGALGGVDPQLKIISQRQQLASQLDPSNPESFMKVAQIAAQSGDQQFAIAVADAGRQAAVQVAQANKERQLSVPADIQKAQMIPQIQDALDQYKALPPSPERDRAIRLLENQLKVLIGDKATNIAAPLQVANRIAEITKLQATLDPQSQDYKTLQIEKLQLQRPEKPVAVAPALQVAERLREISVAQRNLTKDSPEFQDLEIEKVQLQKVEKTEATPAKIQEARTVAKNKGFTEGTPEFNAEVVKYLEKSEKEPSVGSDREAIAKDLFFKPFSQLTQEQVKAVNAKKKADDLDAAKAGTSPQQMQRKAILANKTDLARIVEENAFDASNRLTLARNLRTLLPQAFTGLGSDVLLEASRLAEVFGINIEGVPSSQIIDTILGQLTIGAASNLKGSLSDKDVKFLKETIGTRGLSIRTLQYVADRIEENALIDSGLNDALATYLADEKNDLNKYNFAAERKKITDQIRKDKKRLKELREKQQKSQ
jgi:hypothetical protein